MKLSRRLFFGRAAGAAAAAPLMASNAVAAINPPGVAHVGSMYDTASGFVPQEMAAKDYLAQLARLKPEKVTRERRVKTNDLDPDLIVNRSMSLATKRRIQAERNAVYAFEKERSWIERRIAEMMGADL
jgi:hypothetical protein